MGEADGDPLLYAISEKEADGLDDGVVEGLGDCPLGSSEADGDPLLYAISENEADGLDDGVAEGCGDAPSESEADGLAD